MRLVNQMAEAEVKSMEGMRALVHMRPSISRASSGEAPACPA